MEQPPSERERHEIENVTQWLFDGTVFAEGEPLSPEDETTPSDLIEKWGDWYIRCMDMIDSEGRFRHYPYPGTINDQPAYDMHVYRIIRATWSELYQQRIERSSKINK